MGIMDGKLLFGGVLMITFTAIGNGGVVEQKITCESFTFWDQYEASLQLLACMLEIFLATGLVFLLYYTLYSSHFFFGCLFFLSECFVEGLWGWRVWWWVGRDNISSLLTFALMKLFNYPFIHKYAFPLYLKDKSLIHACFIPHKQITSRSGYYSEITPLFFWWAENVEHWNIYDFWAIG